MESCLSVVDPFQRTEEHASGPCFSWLPSETIQAIFLSLYDNISNSERALFPFYSSLQVCQRWRIIAFQTPAFWTFICLEDEGTLKAPPIGILKEKAIRSDPQDLTVQLSWMNIPRNPVGWDIVNRREERFMRIFTEDESVRSRVKSLKVLAPGRDLNRRVTCTLMSDSWNDLEELEVLVVSRWIPTVHPDARWQSALPSLQCRSLRTLELTSCAPPLSCDLEGLLPNLSTMILRATAFEDAESFLKLLSACCSALIDLQLIKPCWHVDVTTAPRDNIIAATPLISMPQLQSIRVWWEDSVYSGPHGVYTLETGPETDWCLADFDAFLGCVEAQSLERLRIRLPESAQYEAWSSRSLKPNYPRLDQMEFNMKKAPPVAYLGLLRKCPQTTKLLLVSPDSSWDHTTCSELVDLTHAACSSIPALRVVSIDGPPITELEKMFSECGEQVPCTLELHPRMVTLRGEPKMTKSQFDEVDSGLQRLKSLATFEIARGGTHDLQSDLSPCFAHGTRI